MAAALTACALLGGCSALLERSYSMVEPYADRYWDSSAEDTLKVDNYQDLVNSLLMLIEQQAEEAVIRCYDEVSSYREVANARNEVRWETMLGSYLLQDIQFTFEEGANYGTTTFRITYREDAEDLSGIMTLSDSQSLVDLLRLAVREEHEKITARFTYDTPRESVTAAMESYWQELCREEMEVEAPAGPGEDAGAAPGSPGEAVPEEPPENAAEEMPEDAPDGMTEGADPDPAPEDSPGETEAPDSETPEGEGGGGEGEEAGQVPEPIVYPPCPWRVRFYPNQTTAELVEILLQTPQEGVS